MGSTPGSGVSPDWCCPATVLPSATMIPSPQGGKGHAQALFLLAYVASTSRPAAAIPSHQPFLWPLQLTRVEIAGISARGFWYFL